VTETFCPSAYKFPEAPMCGIRTVVSTCVLCVTALTLWLSALAQQTPPPGTGGAPDAVDANTSASSQPTSSLKRSYFRQTVPNRLTLPAVDSPLTKLDSASSGAPRQIGFGREIPPDLARNVEPGNLLPLRTGMPDRCRRGGR